MKELDYDPNLKEAMAKIEAIAKEYDAGFLCVLANRTHAEYLQKFPEWSLIQWNETKQGIKVRTKFSDPSLTDSSFHILFSIRDICGMYFSMFHEVYDQIKEKIQIDHKPFGGK